MLLQEEVWKIQSQSLLERGRLRDCAAGQVLYLQGEMASRVVLVLTGSVEHFVTRQSRDIKLGSAGPNQALAAQAESLIASMTAVREAEG